MERSQDNYRAMMDLVEIKLTDQDSAWESSKITVMNSYKSTFGKIFSSNKSDALYKCVNEATVERRRKLDHELFLLLKDRFHLAPGNIREKFDRCWEESLSKSVAAQANHCSSSVVMSLLTLNAQLVADPQLRATASDAWQKYLLGIRALIKKEWDDASRE